MILLWGAELAQIYNDSYRRLMGKKHPAGLGQPTRQCWPEVWEFNAPLYEGIINRCETFSFENQRLVVERHGQPEEAYFTLNYSPVLDEEGKVGGILVTVSETTAAVKRAQAEAAQIETEERFRLMANAVPQIVWITDAEGRVEFFNQHWNKYTGMDYHPATATDVAAAVVYPDDVGITMERFEQARQSGGTFLVEHRIRSAAGDYRWFLVRAEPYHDPGSGQISRWFGASVDIHDRKHAEERLKEADRRKDEFLAMLAHELRNPLAPIGAAAELLQIVTLDEKRVHQTSQIIGRQVEHMTHLINDLLDVSRVTRGLVTLDTAPVDIRYIVSEAVEQVTPLIQSRRHHFALHMQPDTTIVMGDKKRLVQVLTNLLNNAAKYTNEGGNISLKTDVHDTHVLIEVIDNGIGMTPDLVNHAFELFAQGERDSDRSAGGLGLGLALVKSLVELHHGTVSCESGGIGKGSKFTVCLPRLVKEIRRDKQLSLDGLVDRSAKSLRIMVVDDNRDAAAMLAMLLEAAGHDVAVAYGARQALELAEAVLPEVCLLDIGLPEMDGNELAQRLRAQPETAKSVLIAVTGYGQEHDRKRAMVAGFDHHLVKPVDTKRLATILAGICTA